MNEINYYKAVCRTGPATLGLLTTVKDGSPSKINNIKKIHLDQQENSI